MGVQDLVAVPAIDHHVYIRRESGLECDRHIAERVAIEPPDRHVRMEIPASVAIADGQTAAVTRIQADAFGPGGRNQRWRGLAGNRQGNTAYGAVGNAKILGAEKPVGEFKYVTIPDP